MALLDEDERSGLPSMSWNSVVRGSAATPSADTAPPPSAPAAAPAEPEEPASTATPKAPGPSPTLSEHDAPPVAFSFNTESIAPTNVATPAPPPPPAPAPAFTLPPIDLGASATETPTPSAADADPREGDTHEVHIEPDEAAPLGMAKPTFTSQLPVIPKAPAPPPPPPPPPLAVPTEAAAVPIAQDDPVLPTIVEATPSSSTSEMVAAATADPQLAEPQLVERRATPAHSEPRSTAAIDTNEQPAITDAAPAGRAEPAPPDAPGVPSLAPSIALPSRSNAPSAASTYVVDPAETQRRPKRRKKRSGGVARAGFFLLIVAALVAAGIVFGRPYLFPEAWDSNALEYAEPIEAARNADFAEPVVLTAQVTAIHRALVNEQLLGDPAPSLPMWRALGLAGPDSTDNATLESLISDQAPVLYSTADGQVYYDQSYDRSDRSALITQAMAVAALDQDFGFSLGTDARSLDDAVLTQAHVNQQAAIIQLNTPNRTAVVNPDMAALAFLPPVLDYRLTAPTVFAELLAPVNDLAPNPLAGLAPGAGPGPIPTVSVDQITSTSDVVGDAPIGAAVVTDRAFWYMSFASHLDPATAYEMSNSLQGAGVQMMQNGDRTCAVSTFTTSTPAAAASLKANLDVWAAAAVALDATVVSLPDSSVRVRSCDPGAGFVSFAKFGVARQLMAWRAAELAVTNLVAAQGGSAADLAAAFDVISTTPSVIALAEMPAGTAPTELANAAVTAANDVVALASVSGAQLAPPGEG